MSYKVDENHSLKEYKDKYGDRNLNVYSKDEVAKDESLLNDKNWWLIEDAYYEVEKSSFIALLFSWWKNIKTPSKIIICACALLVVAIIIACPFIVKSCNAQNQGKETASPGIINLTYYPDDTTIEYTNTIQTIKTNETQWTIQFSIKDDVYDWHIGFFIVNGDDWMEIARSPEHSTSEITSYQEVVSLNQNVDLSAYNGQTITVVLFCNMA